MLTIERQNPLRHRIIVIGLTQRCRTSSEASIHKDLQRTDTIKVGTGTRTMSGLTKSMNIIARQTIKLVINTQMRRLIEYFVKRLKSRWPCPRIKVTSLHGRNAILKGMFDCATNERLLFLDGSILQKITHLDASILTQDTGQTTLIAVNGSARINRRIN